MKGSVADVKIWFEKAAPRKFRFGTPRILNAVNRSLVEKLKRFGRKNIAAADLKTGRFDNLDSAVMQGSAKLKEVQFFQFCTGSTFRILLTIYSIVHEVFFFFF